MIRNIKTDIIYYNSQKDFEFEFTLCAACRMRLLTDIAADNNSLLLSLSRSVSRSQIIILYADLTDDFIRTIAEAIGYNTEELDYDTYGITSYENRVSIENAVPLVTNEGRFGGLILESGPQSLIFISSDKAISKEIMKTYVYQYIKDVSEAPTEIVSATTESTQKTEVNSDSFEDTTVVSTQDEETIEEAINDIDTDTDTEEEPIVDITSETEDINSNSKTEDIISEVFDYEDKYQAIIENDEPFSNDDISPVKKKVDITSIILTIILLLLVGFITYLLVIEPLSNGISIIENIKQLFGFGK